MSENAGATPVTGQRVFGNNGAAAAGTLAPGLEAQLQIAQEHELIKCLVVLKGQRQFLEET